MDYPFFMVLWMEVVVNMLQDILWPELLILQDDNPVCPRRQHCISLPHACSWLVE
jgi:hypothetical protein